MNFDFPTFLVLATAITGGIWLSDALWFAPRRKDSSATAPAPKTKEPLIVEYARSFFPVILAVLVLRSFVVEPFRIPSGSMMPTLLVGDFILVNKFSYGLRWPVLNRKFWPIGEPQRGDVVVFRFPQNQAIDYIKRVVAVPGDELMYRNKTLYINGEPMPQMILGEYTGEGAGRGLTGLTKAFEQLGDVQHQVLFNPRLPDFGPGCQVLLNQPITVPAQHYFVMGDNRDNSNDSRCWGLVPDRNLVGKAFVIWMSWDGERSGLPLAFSRIGKSIH